MAAPFGDSGRADVRREGAPNGSRGGCAPLKLQLHGFGLGTANGTPSRGKLFDFDESLWFGNAHLLTPFHMLRNHEFAGWKAFCVVEVSMPSRRSHLASPDQSKPAS